MFIKEDHLLRLVLKVVNIKYHIDNDIVCIFEHSEGLEMKSHILLYN